MNKKIFASVLIMLLVLFTDGCKTRIKTVENAPIVTPSQASLSQIRSAIIKASRRAGWRTKEIGTGELLASYSYKRNRYGATVKIRYDTHSFDIVYYNSHNLNYNENIGNEDGFSDFIRESKDMIFGDGEPDNPDDPASASDFTAAAEKPATIHKIYNKWVTRLESTINSELAGLGKNPRADTSQVAAAPSATAPTQGISDCNDTPDSILSGQARVKRPSVNVRAGPRTLCPVSAAVSQHDTFSIMGQKKNWYYISLSNGQSGWIYAPLVTILDAGTNVASRKVDPSAPPPPAPPPVPTKTISIAVIHFKTLNKEAQDISLGELVSETFTSALVNSRNFKIIEREQLDKVVKEMEMSQTGIIETTDAVEIGKILHADAIITGSVALLKGQIQLNARIIEVKSAYVISADTKTTTYSLQNINRIANEIVVRLSSKLRRI